MPTLLKTQWFDSYENLACAYTNNSPKLDILKTTSRANPMNQSDESLIEKIKELLQILNRLLGPNGCPWDREQTLQSLRATLLEEAAEWVEAVDLDDTKHMEEELGDLFLNLFFIAKLAEKEKRFKMEEPITHLIAKLIRRHPHVFSTKKLESAEDVLAQWESIKKEEKQERKSELDGISKALPALTRALKISKKIKKSTFSLDEFTQEKWQSDDEEAIGKALFSLVMHAQEKKVDPELALRKTLTLLEQQFRAQEEILE